IIGLAPDKASSSDWPDSSAKTAARIKTTPVDSDRGTTAPRASREFSYYLRLQGTKRTAI
ncbi:hypothetical protein NEUTE2DRAFT_66160, partial [Neurospora tetrasperma FGSC 2509]